MTPFILAIIPFMFSWYGTFESGYEPYIIAITTDIENDCNHVRANGCLIEYQGLMTVLAENPFEAILKGCTISTHEYFHLMGYQEHEIPKCR